MTLALLLLLAAGSDPGRTQPDAPPPRLVCREELVISPLLSRRRLCLTTAEWEKRDRSGKEASRRSIYELMGDTGCLSGGICTND